MIAVTLKSKDAVTLITIQWWSETESINWGEEHPLGYQWMGYHPEVPPLRIPDIMSGGAAGPVDNEEHRGHSGAD